MLYYEKSELVQRRQFKSQSEHEPLLRFSSQCQALEKKTLAHIFINTPIHVLRESVTMVFSSVNQRTIALSNNDAKESKFFFASHIFYVQKSSTLAIRKTIHEHH